MTGFLAYSLAGHDKGKVYIIIREDGDYVYLSDGDLKPVGNPKKKNKKHIQVIKKTIPKIDANALVDEEIKYQIKLYCKDI